MTNLKSVILCFLCFFQLNSKVLFAQVQEKLTAQEMSFTIDSINRILTENYVFPLLAEQMAKSVKGSLNAGKYNSFTDPSAFARQLTKDLQLISNDKHLRIVYDPNVIALEQNTLTEEVRAQNEDRLIKEMKRNNFGFHEIRILEGNLGYLDLREFMDPRYARETAVVAMNYLSKADAIIIDLRNNGGGSPAMIQLISSYFFSSEPVHLNDFYDRPTNDTTESWTFREIEGVRRPDVDLYILTSSNTFSAAEEFSYNLKNLKRATLIGETTAGGAHPTGSMIATDKFFVRVPKGRAINPITKTNWEGIGVKPDIEVSSDQALKTAVDMALKRLKKE